MQSKPQTNFLQRRIMELEQALFFYLGDSVLKLPTSIINALFVDEVDQVWFFIKRPSQFINEFDREFGARLDFYKKGKNYYLHLSGKAVTVTDPEEIYSVIGLTDEQKALAMTDMVLVKFKYAEMYYCPARIRRVNSLPVGTKINFQPLAFVKTLQYIVKDIIPVFQSH